MTYQFKVSQELLWTIFTAAVLAVAQVFLIFDPSEISDWRLWAIAAAGSVARAVAAAVIAALSGEFIAGDDAS